MISGSDTFVSMKPLFLYKDSILITSFLTSISLRFPEDVIIEKIPSSAVSMAFLSSLSEKYLFPLKVIFSTFIFSPSLKVKTMSAWECSSATIL